ncbi:hypothetical protein CR513_20816, partial [Mucuna pruriens]
VLTWQNSISQGHHKFIVVNKKTREEKEISEGKARNSSFQPNLSDNLKPRYYCMRLEACQTNPSALTNAVQVMWTRCLRQRAYVRELNKVASSLPPTVRSWPYDKWLETGLMISNPTI